MGVPPITTPFRYGVADWMRLGRKGSRQMCWRAAACLGSVEVQVRPSRKRVDFENRSGAYIFVGEHGKCRKPPFAGRPHLNIDRRYSAALRIYSRRSISRRAVEVTRTSRDTLPSSLSTRLSTSPLR